MACKKCGKMKCSCGGMVNKKKPMKKAMGGMVHSKGKPRVGGQPGGPRWSDTGPYAGGTRRKERPEMGEKPSSKVFRKRLV